MSSWDKTNRKEKCDVAYTPTILPTKVYEYA